MDGYSAIAPMQNTIYSYNQTKIDVNTNTGNSNPLLLKSQKESSPTQAKYIKFAARNCACFYEYTSKFKNNTAV